MYVFRIAMCNDINDLHTICNIILQDFQRRICLNVFILIEKYSLYAFMLIYLPIDNKVYVLYQEMFTFYINGFRLAMF